jgi:hypothetical protein
MEATIKLTISEAEAVCVSHCETILPAPDGMHWIAEIKSYNGVVCKLEDDIIPAPPIAPRVVVDDADGVPF